MPNERADIIDLNGRTSITADELWFTYQRSSGPGGQNVNKVNTRVTLHFDLNASPSLTPLQKKRVRERLASRISAGGVLRVVSSRYRTQAANRRAAIRRFIELMADALHVAKTRRPTRTPLAVKRKRREEKARRSRTKELRKPPRTEE